MNKLILVSQFFNSVWLSRSDLVTLVKINLILLMRFWQIKTNSILKTGVPLISLHAYIRLKTNFMWVKNIHLCKSYKPVMLKINRSNELKELFFFSILFNKFIHLSSMITNEAKQKCSNITCNANSPVWPATLGVQWSKPVLQIKLM